MEKINKLIKSNFKIFKSILSIKITFKISLKIYYLFNEILLFLYLFLYLSISILRYTLWKEEKLNKKAPQPKKNNNKQSYFPNRKFPLPPKKANPKNFPHRIYNLSNK
jgi:hypothetical protein